MEIFRGDKRLANDARTDGFSVAIADLAVGFVFEEQLRQRGDEQRINHAQQNRGRNGHQKCGDQMFFHEILRPGELP